MDEILEQKIEKRQEYNIKILDILAEQVERYPNLRFGQILINTNVLKHYATDPSGFHVFDPFYEESVDIYERIMDYVQPHCKNEK